MGREHEGWGFGASLVLARNARCGKGQANGKSAGRLTTLQIGILIDAVDGAGLHTARPADVVAANTAQPALDGVFLNHIPDGPEIIGTVIVTAGDEQLLRLNRRRALAFVVSEAQYMGGAGENIRLLMVQPQGRPVLRSGNKVGPERASTPDA
ncbi:hypothetical protein [Rhizobium grahamii]|uniref:hypothetical protein n=1 Tax=Rhizobium grahamii TaxID=1120045 RepID=UPI00059550D3